MPSILPAQFPRREAIEARLPPDAQIIEKAALIPIAGKPRMLVLWMLHPQRVPRPPANSSSCEDLFLGDHWRGPARLSLIDGKSGALLNTLEIRPLFDEVENDREHSLSLPFYGPDRWYHVPTPNAGHEGKPVILHLQDLTGEGVPGQFPIFQYQACGIAYSTVFGYSPKLDKVVQYPVELSRAGRKTERVSWVPEVFREKPLRPGQWDFSWEPGHGCECIIHEQVAFDPARQVFVDRQSKRSR